MAYRPPNQGRPVKTSLDYDHLERDFSCLSPLGPNITLDGVPTGGHVLGVGIDTRTEINYHLDANLSAQTVMHFSTLSDVIIIENCQ